MKNRVANTMRRFRQGRMKFSKMKELVMGYLADSRNKNVHVEAPLTVSLPEVEEHVHGEGCTHHS